MTLPFRPYGLDKRVGLVDGQDECAPATSEVERGGYAEVEIGTSEAKINGHVIELPKLGRIHSRLIGGNRAALFTAVDSQRIWLVRSQ